MPLYDDDDDDDAVLEFLSLLHFVVSPPTSDLIDCGFSKGETKVEKWCKLLLLSLPLEDNNIAAEDDDDEGGSPITSSASRERS